MSTDEVTLGLRERKKGATRASLSAVAVRRAIERGVAQVRADDIAAEARVSRRSS
jgi:AcrR family transcriptional regulator